MEQPVLVVYAADRWEHACPMLRLVLPAQHAGINLIKGSNWDHDCLQVYPERLENADAIIITRDFPRWSVEYERIISRAKQLKKTIVYELDDLLMEIPEDHPDYEYYAVARGTVLQAVVEADAVIASSPPICEYLQSFNSKVFLWENYLDDRLWPLTSSRSALDEDPILIGYMGGHSHTNDLASVAEPLERILRKYSKKVMLRFWGMEPPPNLKLLNNVVWIPVAIQDYSEFARYFQRQKCDIWIAPLEDNLFNNCKSHIKFLEYSASGVPGVYSRLAPYESLIQNTKNGFLASTSEDWETYLSTLIENPEIRSKMGECAQETVQKNWLLSNHFNEWREIYTDLYKYYPSKSSTQVGINIARKMVSFHKKQEHELTTLSDLKVQNVNYQRQLIEKNHIILEIDTIAQKYFSLYQDVMYSQSWRFMERLIRLRLRLAPLGSFRNRLLGAGYRIISVLFSQGFLASMRQIKFEFRRKPAQTQSAKPVVQTVLYKGSFLEGMRLPIPAITILLLIGPDQEKVEINRVFDWLNSQTISNCFQVMEWNLSTKEAINYLSGKHSLYCSNLSDLLHHIESPYICLASEYLLQQENTFLETNLLVLESERLAFTINLYKLRENKYTEPMLNVLPGLNASPLMGMVINKVCLRDDFSLDFTNWQNPNPELPENGRRILMQDPELVVGKIIYHKNESIDLQMSIPFKGHASHSLLLIDPYLILDGRREKDISRIFHTIYPIQWTALDTNAHSELPTVLLVMPFLALGGAEKIAIKVIEELADQIRFIVLTFEPLDPELGTTSALFRSITPYVYEFPDFLPDKLIDSTVEYMIRRFDPESIYIANGTRWIFDSLSTLKHRHPEIRIINQVYDYEVGWINRYDPMLLLYLDAHIGSNPKICQAYLEKGVRAEQVFYIENGTDPIELNPKDYDQARIDNLKIKLGLPLKPKVVTFASRLNPQKRPMDFVELARRFSIESDITFFMVGDGPLADTIDQQINRSKLANIIRNPFYTPISDILALSDVLVLPSEYEGMPMIVLEAQTMGKPVVATDVGNIRDILDRTGGGIVISQIGDIAGLMAGIRTMLTKPPSGEEIRRNTLANYDWKLCAEKHIPVFLGEKNA